MIKIVDHRDEDKMLSEFCRLPDLCIFEIPDRDGVYMKLKAGYNVRHMLHDSIHEFNGMNALVLKPNSIGDGDWLAVEPWVKVRALDTELSIMEVKKYD